MFLIVLRYDGHLLKLFKQSMYVFFKSDNLAPTYCDMSRIGSCTIQGTLLEQSPRSAYLAQF